MILRRLNYEAMAQNADGCVYSDADGLNELLAFTCLQMHPNPATDVVTVTFPESVEGAWIGCRVAGSNRAGTTRRRLDHPKRRRENRRQ